MNAGVSANGFGTEIGVTVFAAVAAGIVCTNIQTFDAAAFESLIFVLANCQRTAQKFAEQSVINAAGVFVTLFRQVNIFWAGIYFQSIALGDGRHIFCQTFL